MKSAILGAGGREHAFAEALQRDSRVSEIGIFGQNPGMQRLGKVKLHDLQGALNPGKFVELGQFLQDEGYASLLVGPENPLADGIVNAWKNAGIDLPIFGPDKEAARLEASKGFARKFMEEFGIPSPRYFIVDNLKQSEGEDRIREEIKATGKVVLKADGLAGGKGVEILEDPELAIQTLRDFFRGKYGPASSTVVIEECMVGMEFSAFALADGTGNYKLLPSAQDHKRLLHGDQGPNTGGMGVATFRAPPGGDAEAITRELEEKIIRPTVDGIQSRGMNYKGVIYFGLMITSTGIKVVEYNIRFGDPEAEIILPLINTPFSEIVEATVHGKLAGLNIDVSSDHMAGVVMASKGYPVTNNNQGVPITGIDAANILPGVQVFHAGTSRNAEGVITATGGRVLVVTGRGDNLLSALDRAYEGVGKISFDGEQHRWDIGSKLLAR